MATSHPRVSVVVATRNRAERLGRLLAALDRQRIDDFELVLVDDASTDATPRLIAERESREHGPPARGVRLAVSQGPAVARNAGWPLAQASLVAFTDDDCEPAPGWLEALAEAAAETPGTVLQGRTEPNPRELGELGPYSRTLNVHSLGPWFPTANMAYPRELLERIDGFDESFAYVGEDADLAWRALEAGADVRWVDGALVHHAVVDLGPVGRLRIASQWAPAFRLFARHPGLRERLPLGLFWKHSHQNLGLALLGLLAARRAPLGLALALPYAWGLRVRMTSERARAVHAPYYALHDLVEVATAVRGSVAARTLVL